MMTKIAFLSDVHIAPAYTYDVFRRKMTKYALPCIRSFLDRIASQGDFSFAVQLGDLIQDADRDTDRIHYQKGAALLSRCVVPVHHLAGNHDTANLSPDEIASILNRKGLYYSFDHGAHHFIFLHTCVPDPETSPRIIIPEEQMAWLEKDLDQTDKPTTVFCHHSLADQDLTGNPWFARTPEECLVENRKEVRQLLKHSGRVIAVVNGHLHWNHTDWHDGIPFLTVQSAIEVVDDKRTPADAWGVITINRNRFSLNQYGKDPFAFSYAFDDGTTVAAF